MDHHTWGAIVLALLIVLCEVRVQANKSYLRKARAIKTIRIGGA